MELWWNYDDTVSTYSTREFFWYLKWEDYDDEIYCVWVNFDGAIGFNTPPATFPSPFDFTDPCYQPGPHCAGHRIPETELVF